MLDNNLPSYIPEEEEQEALQKLDKRTRARVIAFQLCVQDDANPQNPNSSMAAEMEQQIINDSLHGPKQQEMAAALFEGIREHKAEIDEKIGQMSENWSLNRIALTDRNAIRLGIYELMYTDTPVPVVINEAVEIAKMFGSENSAAFVNGILDKVAKSKNTSSN